MDLQAVWAKGKKDGSPQETCRGGEVIVWETGRPGEEAAVVMRIYFSAKKSQDFARIYVVSSPVP